MDRPGWDRHLGITQDKLKMDWLMGTDLENGDDDDD